VAVDIAGAALVVAAAAATGALHPDQEART
jgi:hypothetical protein